MPPYPFLSRFNSKYSLPIGEEPSLTYEDLEFQTSWNWIMPVVEKIETGLWDITKSPKYYIIQKYCERNNRAPITHMSGQFHVFYDASLKAWHWRVEVDDLVPHIDIADSDENPGKSKIMAYYKASTAFVKWLNNLQTN